HPPARGVRAQPRPRRGLRPRDPPHAGHPRRARRRAPPPADRMRVGCDIHIAAPREAIWKVISDPGAYLHFMSGITRWEVMGDKPTGLGARYRMLLRVGSAEVGGLIEIVEWTEPSDLAWTSLLGLDQRGRWRL